MRFLHWQFIVEDETGRDRMVINGLEVLWGVVLAGVVISLGYLVLAWIP
ncbi:hypothetical protein LCGC14_1611600 [marine sediment metagenome]|uniref:Uncharacterized protein n=1 Tax=marine sediment metagenome TaxID=412755 RepID=A0A0F9I8E5_9ZZZZ